MTCARVIRVAEDVARLARQRSDTDTGAADYAEIASGIPAHESMGTIAGTLDACNLALTLLVTSGRQVVDLLSSCGRLAWFDSRASAPPGAGFRLSAGRHAADSSVVSLRFGGTLACCGSR